ncbi:hypothetical protein CaCOL14_006485 [Colletotrichum acutatum]
MSSRSVTLGGSPEEKTGVEGQPREASGPQTPPSQPNSSPKYNAPNRSGSGIEPLPLPRRITLKSAGDKPKEFFHRFRRQPVHPACQGPSIDSEERPRPRGGPAQCDVEEVLKKVLPRSEGAAYYPEFDAAGLYVQSEDGLKALWHVETERLMKIAKNPDTPLDFSSKRFLQGDTEKGYRDLSKFCQKVLTAITICLLDNECINAEHCGQLSDHHRLSSLIRQVSKGQGAAESFASMGESEPQEDALRSLGATYELINYISAVLTRLIVQTSSGSYWQTNVLSVLIKRITKIKLLLIDLHANSTIAVRAAEAILSKVRESGDTQQKRGEMDEEEECEEYMRMVEANEKEGTASFEDSQVAAHCVEQNKFRFGLNSALRHILMSLRFINRSGLPATSFEICAVAYETGFEGFKALLFQDRDLEYSATSDLDNMNTAHSAFNILNQIVMHLKHQSHEHEAYTNGLKTTLQWRYSGDEDNRSGQVDIDLVGYSQRLQLNSMDEVITVMVPLVMTCPVFLSDFTSFRHVMALTGFIQDDVQPLAEGKFGAFFRMYTSEFASMKRPDVLHLSEALECGFFSRSGLVRSSHPPPREQHDATHRLNELKKLTEYMDEWVVDETSRLPLHTRPATSSQACATVLRNTPNNRHRFSSVRCIHRDPCTDFQADELYSHCTSSDEMASAEEGADAMEIEVSPKNRTSVEHDIHQSLGSISNSVESLEMRADPDAQATVTDFLDFTEYLPSDMTRSLTLIGKLDQTYTEASINVHNLTSTWGKLPSIPAEERPSPVQLRADISDSLNHAVSSRVYAHAEAVRMSENVNRHYNRANTILAKLKNLLENYPAEEQKSPVATSKSQLVRAPRVMRNGDGEKVRRPRIPRITVPGEVLPPYDQFVAYSDDSDESSEEEDDESLGRTPARTTPAPRIKVVKTPKARPPKTPKAASSARPPKSAAGLTAAATPAVVLQPPPENAVIGSADAPWLQLTPWELARLRKRMKKNATWSPSDTMILRELKTLGRGIDAYKEAKKKAEDEGRVFDQVPAALAPDAEAGNKPIPEGAISAAALASDDIQLSNRGMKLNEAKKLKRESLAKQAAEEAEESARQFREAARLLMSHEASSSSAANNTNTTTTTTTNTNNNTNNNNATTPSTANNNATNTAADLPKGASKAKTPAKPKSNGNKRKRDSVPEAEAEKPEQPPVETPAPRPAPKRTKTETPVPLPHLRASLAAQPLTESTIPPPVLTPGGTAVTPKMTTPVPIPVPGQDGSATIGTGVAAAKPANTSAPASSPTGSVGPPASAASTAPASILTKLPAETPIPPPILSPKKSTTPILPPVRDSAARRETRGEMAKKSQQQQDNSTLVPAPQVPQAQRSSSAAPSIKQSSSRAATPGTTPVPDGQGRRPSSRGKAMSQEPQPSLATDRPRRASTARNTPAPEQRQQSKRTRKPVPGIVSKTNAGGSSAVGKRKAAPKKKRAQKKEKGQPIEIELEEDDEGNPIDPKEPRYCDCNRVSFGEMIACDNENCDKEWFHLECMGMTHIPARTTKWYCPDCRLRLNIGEKGEINARGVKA